MFVSFFGRKIKNGLSFALPGSTQKYGYCVLAMSILTVIFNAIVAHSRLHA
jgi:hypothetical protein